MANPWNPRVALLTTLLAAALLAAFYTYQLPAALELSTPPAPPSSGIPGLAISLNQTTRGTPATLVVALENHHQETVYTVLKWGTPMDPSALDTAVFSIVDADTREQIHQDIQHVNRKVPPPPNQLVTLAPGARQEFTVVFERPWMSRHSRPATYKVSAKGVFKAGWAKAAEGLTRQELYAYAESPFSQARFATEEVVLEV
ncbi:hypothetical protein ACJQWK_07492 [Exserohilum turcicum]|uniref:Uncharacterized protein n=1 Tax=Exserohilum turcicum (strain 28A) TaxID=671987 RepID=R0KME7_EXST2|nr:uncharacterized protein SETTUDRAFT_36942 [Exserohilum turcica Et28A]EOA90294.1 hypothetical protein SETTUDRAFT_36942 [Exserohilum turcica Et28A]